MEAIDISQRPQERIKMNTAVGRSRKQNIAVLIAEKSQNSQPTNSTGFGS